MSEDKLDGLTSREEKNFAKRDGSNTVIGDYRKVTQIRISELGNPETQVVEEGSFRAICQGCLSMVTIHDMYEIGGRFFCRPCSEMVADEILEESHLYDHLTVTRARLILRERRARIWSRLVRFLGLPSRR